MRRSRRGKSGIEFGGSGEDSFVAVVVTKLTGALLFILLLTMVIMALVPKAIDTPRSQNSGERKPLTLAIATPEALPEAIAGRPYTVALAATGGLGPKVWAIDGPLPQGLSLDEKSGVIRGTPKTGTPRPVELTMRVRDDSDRTAKMTRLVVYQPQTSLTMPTPWTAAGLPPIPWKMWLEQGFGFLVLLLIHVLGMNAVAAMERIATASVGDEAISLRRFAAYRTVLRLMTLGAAAGLGLWLWMSRG